MLLLLLNHSLLGQLRFIESFASNSRIHRGIIEQIVLIPHNFIASDLHSSLSQVPLLLIQVPNRLRRRIQLPFTVILAHLHHFAGGNWRAMFVSHFDVAVLESNGYEQVAHTVPFAAERDKV